MFRGSQFNSRINGGQTMATENFFDGAAFGYAEGHQQSHESAPPADSIQEMKVITTTYSAQYGHTSGGFIEYVSKSGTNNIHGTAYEFFANDALNARGFFDADCDRITGRCTSRKKTPIKNNAFGFTLGGPVVIPKVYNGRNKTFFFTNFDWTRLREGVLPGFGNTTPIDSFKQGDFSSPLWFDPTKVVATDVLGRPIYQGEIFNPSTSRLVGSVQVRDGYGFDPLTGLPIAGQANIIPANDPLRSIVASRIVPLINSPDRLGTLFGNVAGNPAGDQTWRLNARVIEFRVDHQFTPNFRMSESFYWGHRPAIRRCNQSGHCTASVMANGETAPQKNTGYYGNGFYQRIATHHTHTQFDWIIRSNLLNHTTVAWDRWFMGGNPLSAGVGWPSVLWAGTAGGPQGGLVDNTAGPPLLNFAGDIPYDSMGDYGWPRFGFEVNNRWQFSDDLSWVKAKHTLRVGFEYRRHQFPFAGWATGGQGGQFDFNRRETAGYDKTGNFVPTTGESFASFLLGQVDFSTQTLPFHPMFYEAYLAPWINDEFKATKRLTLTFGLRFDYQFAKTEQKDRYSTFDPNALQTPAPGDPQIRGAIIFAGSGPGRSGRHTFESPNHDAWGPRFGFAYRVGDKTAIRGGYGMYYSGVSFSQFTGQPTLGFQSNPTVANSTNGFSPVFHWDQGFPVSAIKYPPFIDPTIGNGSGPIAVAKNGITLPRYQNWSLTFERQLTNNMRLDVSYIANRGTRLTNIGASLGVGDNMNDPSVLTKYGHALLGKQINQQNIVPTPYPSFSGTVAQALRSFPQYQNLNFRGVPTGSSMYNALEVVLEQRLSHGLQFRFGYTYSKLHNDGAESGQGDNGINTPVQNPACPHKCEWGVSADDVPNVFLVGYTYELPGSHRWHGAAGALLGGWNLSGALRYESGRPLNIAMDNSLLGGFLFNSQRRPNRVKGVSPVVSRSGFNPLAKSYFNFNAWADPGVDSAGNALFGNAPRRDGSVRGWPTYSEDMSVYKEFTVKEQLKMRFTAEAGNIFNRTDFCDPGTFWGQNTGFGTITTQCNQPRSFQFGLKFSY
jgi:TonB-dependent receptor-like protein